MSNISDLKLKYEYVLNEYKIFSRFLKEYGDYVYTYYIKEAFREMYEKEMKKPHFLQNTFLYYNADINFNDRSLYTLSYNEFMIRRIIKYGGDSFVRLLCLRNAHYKNSKNKLIHNINWIMLEELWLIYIIENSPKFSMYTLNNAFFSLVRRYNYKQRDLVEWLEKGRKNYLQKK